MAEKWNDQLRRKMADYEAAPPEGLWESIEAGLERRRAAAFPWRWALTGAGLAAALTAVVAVVLLWVPRGTSGPDMVAVVPNSEAVAEKSAVPDEAAVVEEMADAAEAPEEEVSVDADALPVLVPSTRRLLAEAEPAAAEEADVAEETGDASDAPAEDATVSIEEVPVADAEIPTEDIPVTPGVVTDQPAEQAAEAAQGDAPSGVSSFPGPEARPSVPVTPSSRPDNPGHRKRTRVRQGRRVSGSLIAGTVPGGPATTSFTEIGMPAMFDLSTKANNKTPDVMTLTRNRETENDVSHSVTGTIGFMLNVPITEQWAIEGGIQRTVLYSYGTSTTGEASSNMTRTTAYTGYPVMAVFTPWRGKYLSVYVSGGPMLENALRSRWTSESFLGTYSMGSKSGTDHLDEWIASVGVAAGAQVEIGGLGALFVQPGFRWRFPGQDSIDSFYKERPRTFNLTAGFRVSF